MNARTAIRQSQARSGGFGPGMMGGPGGAAAAGPGGGPMAMMPGEKARDFRGTMSKLIQYLRVYRISILVVLLIAALSTVFTIVGPKILGQATTKLFEGVMALLAGTGSIDFNAIGSIILTVAGAVPDCIRLQLRPGLDHVRHLDEGHLPVPQGYLGKNQPHAAALLRRHQPRRGAFAHHQRCRHGQPDAQPEPVADRHLGHFGASACW